MGFQKNVPLFFEYEYDFDVDGGAVGTIAMRCLGANALASGLVLKNFTLYIETTLTSGGSATLTLGNSADADGYSVDFFGTPTAGVAFAAGAHAGALLWDDTNDVALEYVIPSAAASIPKLTVGTAALTAGKIKVVFEAFQP